MPDVLSAVEWSQAAWRIAGHTVETEYCAAHFLNSLLLESLPRDGVVLDAGCGTGAFAIHLLRKGYRIVAIDLSRDACSIAAQNEEALPLIEADTQQLPLRDSSVDAILSLGVVEHDEAGPAEGLAALRQVLKPDGLLFLSIPFNSLFRRVISNPIYDYVTWKRRREGWSLGFSEYRFTRREMARYLRDGGFDVLSVHPNDLYSPMNMGFWVDYQQPVVSQTQS